MDGRKNNKGVKGNNGGRKPKAAEIALAEAMDKIAPVDEVLQKLWDVASTGDSAALKLWLAYRLGSPATKVDVTSNGNTLPTLSVTVVDPNASQ